MLKNLSFHLLLIVAVGISGSIHSMEQKNIQRLFKDFYKKSNTLVKGKEWQNNGTEKMIRILFFGIQTPILSLSVTQ